MTRSQKAHSQAVLRQRKLDADERALQLMRTAWAVEAEKICSGPFRIRGGVTTNNTSIIHDTRGQVIREY